MPDFVFLSLYGLGMIAALINAIQSFPNGFSSAAVYCSYGAATAGLVVNTLVRTI